MIAFQAVEWCIELEKLQGNSTEVSEDAVHHFVKAVKKLSVGAATAFPLSYSDNKSPGTFVLMITKTESELFVVGVVAIGAGEDYHPRKCVDGVIHSQPLVIPQVKLNSLTSPAFVTMLLGLNVGDLPQGFKVLYEVLLPFLHDGKPLPDVQVLIFFISVGLLR